jgi:hypothetical protein
MRDAIVEVRERHPLSGALDCAARWREWFSSTRRNSTARGSIESPDAGEVL